MGGEGGGEEEVNDRECSLYHYSCNAHFRPPLRDLIEGVFFANITFKRMSGQTVLNSLHFELEFKLGCSSTGFFLLLL